MCLAIPGQIIAIEQKRATIDIMGVTREISLEFLESVAVGDYVIIHAGCAISKLEQQAALEIIELLRKFGEESDETADSGFISG